MATGYEVKMYQDLTSMEASLKSIAKSLAILAKSAQVMVAAVSPAASPPLPGTPSNPWVQIATVLAGVTHT